MAAKMPQSGITPINRANSPPSTPSPPSSSPNAAPSTAANSAGVARQNSYGRQPSNHPATPASRRAPSAKRLIFPPISAATAS